MQFLEGFRWLPFFFIRRLFRKLYLIQSVLTKIDSMKEKEIVFTDSEIEILHQICQQALANDSQEQAQSILQKITTAQHVPDLTSVEAATTQVPSRGRRPKVHPATVEIVPETNTAEISPSEPIHVVETTPEVVLEVIKEVPEEKPVPKLKFLQFIIQKLRPAIGM